ncbi:hypothetical protein ACP4OV_023888 [Aristida adscensionis]
MRRDHPKDAEFLNTPIENYLQMQIIFGSGQATGRFAMGSNEPLGTPSEMTDGDLKEAPIDLTGDTPKYAGKGEFSAQVKGEFSGKGKGEYSGKAVAAEKELGDGPVNIGKRKRVSEEDAALMKGMTTAVNNVEDAMVKPVHNEVHQDLYQACMGTAGFTGCPKPST